jgi:hypothetical protein
MVLKSVKQEVIGIEQMEDIYTYGITKSTEEKRREA